MKSIPTAHMQRTAPHGVRVLCPTRGCGAVLTTLPPGVRPALSSQRPNGRVVGTCDRCGEPFDLGTIEERS